MHAKKATEETERKFVIEKEKMKKEMIKEMVRLRKKRKEDVSKMAKLKGENHNDEFE